MAAVTGLPESPGVEHIEAEIRAVLASEIFSRAPSLALFLGYVCRKALHGESDQIKEYSIAVEAFGRQPNFDQKSDAIVRVEAHRLRKRLKQYYETDGAEHLVQIVMPAGQYVPVFVWKPRPEPAPAPGLEPVGAWVSEPPAAEPAAPAADVPERRRGFRMWLWLGIGAALAFAAAISAVVLSRDATPGAAALSGSGAPTAAAAAVVDEDGIRIACGLETPKYVDSLGNTWLGDRYYTGGQILYSPADSILRTRDTALFQKRREGDFRYDIPLPAGVYEMHLYFAERVFGPGNLAGGGETSRLFHVVANDRYLVENLDVVSDAAGSNTADVRVFKDLRPAKDGYLHVRFSSYKETAFVNGIAVLPGLEGRMLPVRIAPGPAPIRDAAGRLWTDQYSLGGQIVTRSTPVSGADVPEVYRSERFGNFNYSIPVADGRYAVTLYFAETWFGPSKPGGGGAGSRLFDVYCNGTALLKNFDVFKTAGGGNRAIKRVFRSITPNAQGKLLLSFVPVRNYAIVNAIEVVAEP